MLGAIVTLLLVVAAAFAVTQIGGVITLLFIAAVLLLAYRRLSLLTFTATFTVLLAAYTWLGAASAPAGIWKGFLWVMLARLWLLNVRPLRKALITRPVHEGLPEAPALDVADREGSARGGHGVVGRRAVHRRAALGEAARRASRRSSRPRSRPSSTAPAKSCAACSMTGTSRTSAAICRRRCGSS